MLISGRLKYMNFIKFTSTPNPWLPFPWQRVVGKRLFNIELHSSSNTHEQSTTNAKKTPFQICIPSLLLP